MHVEVYTMHGDIVILSLLYRTVILTVAGEEQMATILIPTVSFCLQYCHDHNFSLIQSSLYCDCCGPSPPCPKSPELEPTSNRGLSTEKREHFGKDNIQQCGHLYRVATGQSFRSTHSGGRAHAHEQLSI